MKNWLAFCLVTCALVVSWIMFTIYLSPHLLPGAATSHDPVVVLQGSSLDFVPDGSNAVRVFRDTTPSPKEDLLFTATHNLAVANVSTHTVDQVCEALYVRRGTRVFVGMLESALLLQLSSFARRHPDCLIVSASSSVPRTGLLGENVFRLYANDVHLPKEVRKVLEERFPPGVVRVVMDNGTPDNAWASSVEHLLMQLSLSAYGGYQVVSKAQWSAEEAEGTPRDDTVYIYVGGQQDFHLLSHFGARTANVLVMSGTGWTVAGEEAQHLASHRAYTFDMVNSSKMMLAAQMRTRDRRPWSGYLLQAIVVATTVSQHHNGASGELLSQTCLRLFGPGSHRVFTWDGDGNPEGALLDQLRNHTPDDSANNTTVKDGRQGMVTYDACGPVSDSSYTHPYSESDAWSADATRYALLSVSSGIVKPVTCMDQVVACANAVQTGNLSLMRSGCLPAMLPFDDIGNTCIDHAGTGSSDPCVQSLFACITAPDSLLDECTLAAQWCTQSALLTHGMSHPEQVLTCASSV